MGFCVVLKLGGVVVGYVVYVGADVAGVKIDIIGGSSVTCSVC